jgi:parvulin-like peptidyl-prolyl isomerase
MTPLKKMSLRLAIYGAVFLYLLGDLFVFTGPLRRRINLADPATPEAIAKAKSRGVVARVFNHQITRTQLDRAVAERLWLEGKTLEDFPPALLKPLRLAALNDLIDHELLRVKAKAHAPDLKVTDAEVDERLRRLMGRFESRDAMEAAMKSQGIPTGADLRDRLAARLQQERYVESKVRPLSEVTDDEARKWFDEHTEELALPERVAARHIFIATLDTPAEQAKAKLETALADLVSNKKDFATLARELSEDPATRETGGALGWMTRARLPADFSEPLFALPPAKPALIRTRLGWHLVEVTGRKPAEPRTFQHAKPEVLAALRTLKRQQAANDYRHALRQFEAAKIQVFHDMLE